MPAFGGATGQSLLGVREPLAARHCPVREARKQVEAVEFGTCVRQP